jgi:hypothetical protein
MAWFSVKKEAQGQLYLFINREWHCEDKYIPVNCQQLTAEWGVEGMLEMK